MRELEEALNELDRSVKVLQSNVRDVRAAISGPPELDFCSSGQTINGWRKRDGRCKLNEECLRNYIRGGESLIELKTIYETIKGTS